MKTISTLICTAVTLMCSSLYAAAPVATSSEFLLTERADFLVKQGTGAMYSMTLSVRRHLSEPKFVAIKFENPADKQNPFVENIKLTPGQKILMTRSPEFKKIKNNRNYEVEIAIFDDEGHTKRIGKHVQEIAFRIKPEQSVEMGLELF